MARSMYILVALLVGGCCTALGVQNYEIEKLSKEMFRMDKHMLSRYVKIDLQDKIASGRKPTKPLLTVNHTAINSVDANVRLLTALYDKYTPDCRVPEIETDQKKQEQSALLDGLMATPVFAHTLKFLAGKGKISAVKAKQKEYLRNVWFSLYARRGCKLGSSAFEHVFLGELTPGRPSNIPCGSSWSVTGHGLQGNDMHVSGLHSWLFFNHEEERRRLNYQGWKSSQSLEQSGALLLLRFLWLDARKPWASMFVGTSPELEMSLYTLCFLVRPNEKCYVSSASGVRFYIQTHEWKNTEILSSAYPCLV